MKLRHWSLILLAGCSSSPAVTGTPADASSDAGAPSDASMPEDGDASDDTGADAGVPCNAIANGAPVVDVTQIAADPPAPQGGRSWTGRTGRPRSRSTPDPAGLPAPRARRR